MRLTTKILLLSIIATGSVFADEAKKAAQPTNCQVKLMKEAGASTIELDFFASGKEQCLRMSEPNVDATFKTGGMIERRKRGAGPAQ